MSFEAINKEIRDICKDILENKTVDVVLAYKGGGIDNSQIPYFAKNKDDAEKIEWGNRCYQHLASYLHGRKDKVGIVAKPCDVRAIIQYINEAQINRENVYIIGVDCLGMVDALGNYRPGCADCSIRIPPIYDVHVEDKRVNDIKMNDKDSVGEDLEKNLDRFKKEIDKCILCYSCRQACYGCYCKTCFIERDIPDWQSRNEKEAPDTGTKMMFHLGRTMHLAGRCIECGACEAACASGVNVRYLIKEVTNFMKDMYDYDAGAELDKRPAMLTYALEDREVGFLGGEDK